MLENVIAAANMAQRYRDAMLSDLTHEQWTQTAPSLPYHPASIVAHLAAIEGCVLAVLEGRAPSLPEGWMEMVHCAQAKPGATYPSKEKLLAALNDYRGQILSCLGKATPQELAAPVEHDMLKRIFPTHGALMVASLTVHESTHNGQLSAWRAAMGMELPI
jgi:hypothetical protein